MKLYNGPLRRLLRRRLLENPRVGILQVLREINRTDSRFYAALLTDVLSSLPDDLLSLESLLATLSKKIPVENKRHSELLRIVSSCMDYAK